MIHQHGLADADNASIRFDCYELEIASLCGGWPCKGT